MGQEIGPLEAIKEFFGSSERPVTAEEIRGLGVQGVFELGPECAKALGKPYREPKTSK